MRCRSTVLPVGPSPRDRRYVVVFSDDDEQWTIALGGAVYYSSGCGLNLDRSPAVRHAPTPKAAIADLIAPPGRVFRVTDIDSGDLQEFVVEHIRATS